MVAGTIFQWIVIVGTIAVFGGLTVHSIRRRGSIEPALAIGIGYFVAGPLLEPVFDWDLYAQFHPDFWRAPGWGPLGLAHQGLPAVAAPAYAVYFLVSVYAAVALADLVGPKVNLRRGHTLLLCGYVTGFLWDLAVEIVGTQANMWGFTRVAPGLVPFSETREQLPLAMPLGWGFSSWSPHTSSAPSGPTPRSNGGHAGSQGLATERSLPWSYPPYSHTR